MASLKSRWKRGINEKPQQIFTLLIEPGEAFNFIGEYNHFFLIGKC